MFEIQYLSRFQRGGRKRGNHDQMEVLLGVCHDSDEDDHSGARKWVDFLVET